MARGCGYRRGVLRGGADGLESRNVGRASAKGGWMDGRTWRGYDVYVWYTSVDGGSGCSRAREIGWAGGKYPTKGAELLAVRGPCTCSCATLTGHQVQATTVDTGWGWGEGKGREGQDARELAASLQYPHSSLLR